MLAVKPKKPQFDLQQVGVQYMGISAPNPSASPDPTSTAIPASASLSLTINMLFTAVNPNKVGIRYGESSFTVMYSGIPLGKALVPGFYQEAHSQRQVKATISVDRYSLMQAYASDLIRDASLNDRVELRVLGQVGAKIRVLDFDSPGVQWGLSGSNHIFYLLRYSETAVASAFAFAVGYTYRVDVSCSGFALYFYNHSLPVAYCSDRLIRYTPRLIQGGRWKTLYMVSVDCAIVISPRKQSLTYKQCGFDGLNV
ncbi:hypothetical protein POTOM_061545 [Populus tomentosa]|uniref:Late embryogenesis abundant protein LEA-2 subgroup domain-containing protein n=1 Tax=Populus tomentosa TaxID=118781 RepID=A0A8X8C135_POPTO|nr:hypothetical protein POTOM_061545 [Populus tomentosa]